MRQTTPVVGLDRAADEQDHRLRGELARRVGGERGEAVALNEHHVDLRFAANQFAEDEARERNPSAWANGRRYVDRWRPTDLDAAFDLADENAEVKVLGEPFDEPNVRAALDNKQQARKAHARHRSKMARSWER